MTTPNLTRRRESIIDPALFAAKWLGSPLWRTQRDIAHSVATRSRTAVKACHASGKTHVAARIALWYLARWKECIVITTAPTAVQVEKAMWGEMHSAMAAGKYPFPKSTLTELKISPKRYAMGLTTSVTKGNEGVRFQGFHADHILVILDEAPGIEPKIWEAIEGARAGGDVRILALGNPTIPGGPFGDAFKANRAGWSTFTISAFDTPNLAGLTLEALLALPDGELDKNVNPYLITRRWVVEKYHEWGPNSALWQARVLGQFPDQSDDALLSLAWLEKAKIGAVSLDAIRKREGRHITGGIDVAGPGEDDTVLTLRSGGDIFLQKGWASADPRGELVAELLPWWPQIKVLNVDAIGIGWNFVTHLADLKLPVNAVNVGVSPSDKERFTNLKAEAYWSLRLWFESGDVTGELSDKSIAQLSGIRYKMNSRGQTMIESKEDARKRGVKSPDYAESTMLAFLNMPDQETDEFMETPDEDLVSISAY